jgi:non-canonical purine NTP pyrophosphatase (RdgB/HAM1 family)
MKTITLVTGNRQKLREFQRLLPPSFEFEMVALDLNEIQSFDPKVIVEDKVRRAYEKVQRPVVVEDVSAGLDSLNGLPGPFIKFFEQQLGKDALYKLAGADTRATVTCTIGYYDGTHVSYAVGTVSGHAVPMRGTNGFGFDAVFMPDGHNKTFAEMDPSEKDAVSHRGRAVRQLTQLLQ